MQARSVFTLRCRPSNFRMFQRRYIQKPGSKSCFHEGKGFQNPFDYLASCYKTKNEVDHEVKQALSSSSHTQIFAHFSTLYQASQKEKAVYHYLKLTIFKNAPISISEDNLYREFSKYYLRVGLEFLKEVLFNIVEIVERLISGKMRNT